MVINWIMELDIVLRTIIPLTILIGLGYLSKLCFLKPGDERVLSTYIYYFALPALFIVDLSKISLNEENIRFILAGITPTILLVSTYLIIHLIIRLHKETLFLLILSTAFGSTVFFGIPFVMFAFPAEGEAPATLAASTMAVIGVFISLVTLEAYRMERISMSRCVSCVARMFSKNPLIISILVGFLLSLTDFKIPDLIAIPLHMLGGTTATVSIFMLGAFLHGRKYSKLTRAFTLSLIRIIVLPTLALLVAQLFSLSWIHTAILVVMHGVPVAVSMIVLSERYKFYEELISTLILISSLGAALYLNLWLLIISL